MSHGNASSFYFSDPEGNRLEFYTPSPWYVTQPCGEPVDFSRPTAELLAETEAQVRRNPSFQPIAQWSSALGQRLHANLANAGDAS